MSDREELIALRRLAELEAKAGTSQPAPDPSEGGLPFRPFGIDTGMQMPQGVSRFMAGAGKAFTDLARGAGQYAGMVSREDVDAAKNRDAPLMRTGAGMAGNLAGNVAASLPTAAIPGVNTMVGATALGAGMGALQPVGTQDSRLQNVGQGALWGAIGQGAANTIGHLARPVQSSLDEPAASLAAAAKQKYGIPLDVADMTGSRPLQTIRSVLKDMPLTADKQAAAQAAKQNAFNRAIGSTFGATDDKLTPEVIAQAKQRIGQQFTDLSTRNALKVDNQLLTDIGGIVGEANRVQTPSTIRALNSYVDDLLSKADNAGEVPGKAYRVLDSALGKRIRGTSDGDLKTVLAELQGKVREAMDRSISTADQTAWRGARGEYSALKTVEDLANRSATGDVSGQALLNVVNRAKNGQAAKDLGELGRIGRLFIADPIPNSGTPARTFYQDLLQNPLSALWRGGVGGLTLPAQAAINAQNGVAQRYLTQGLLPITPETQALLNAVGRGGAIATPGLLGYPAQQ